jgi:hypothetical protein
MTENTNAAVWATSAANKFREAARTTENPNTKLLAEGLTHLAEGVRELHIKSLGPLRPKSRLFPMSKRYLLFGPNPTLQGWGPNS